MKSLKEKDVENEMAKQRLRVSFPREVVNEEESVQWGNRIYMGTCGLPRSAAFSGPTLLF